MRNRTYLYVILFLVPLWLQVTSAAQESVDTTNTEGRMITPPVVSGQSYPVAPESQERSNYLLGGVTFTTAYSNNVLGSANGNPVSDVSYSVWPTVAIDQTTSRLHWKLNYAPGFTFYQHTSSYNETDQNAVLDFGYRLSPHVTFAARDSFQKSSNFFNQPDLASAGAVSGGAQGPNQSVIAPLADRLSNFGNVGITYQFSANDMIGGSGSFSRLTYPNPTQVQGLYDSSSQAASGFYAHRVSQIHYVGATYQYQRLMSYPTGLQSETQTQAILLFYSVSPVPRLSLSLFGGPQYSSTSYPPFPSRGWTPAAGASMNWQGQFTALSASYLHVVSSGGGLTTASQMDSASASIRMQFSRALSAGLSGSYANNNILGPALFNNNGHSFSATAFVQRPIGERMNLQLGYTRLHQIYSNVAVLAGSPDTNRVFVSVSYQFLRPLGR
jgi:hypothetical protein